MRLLQVLVTTVLAAVVALAAAPQQDPATVIPVDVVVLDRDGRFVEGLRPADFAVTVDGRPRPALWIRRVSRGPGASTDASSRLVSGDAGASYASEPRRNAVIVVDESTLLRGDEASAVRAAGAFLDRLGIDDRIAVLRVPTPADTLLTLSTERPVFREVLSKVTGQLTPDRATADDLLAAAVERSAAVDPGRERVTDPDRVGDPERAAAGERPPDPPPATPPEGQAAFESIGLPPSLAAVRNLVTALRSVSGRKIVVLFSAGVIGPGASAVNETAAAAVAARVSVYVFGLQRQRDDPRVMPETAPLETLAAATGGAFAMLGRQPERTAERAASELSACYVLGIQAAPSDADARRHALRVDLVKRGLSVRAARWLPPSSDAGDVAATAPAPAPPPIPRPGVAPPGTSRPIRDPAREAELQIALARLYDYVQGYERQYSALVAEELYRQSIRSGENRQLRSDFLLIRPGDEWVSFRDAFEVDGHPVRDRDDRLKRLFLDPTPQARERLQSVVDESVRYNIGPVFRTINVPLFPLSFVRTYNRGRFDFRLDGQRDAAGARVWRIAFDERLRPTLVEDLQGDDVPMAGWFLVEQATGALVETMLLFTHGASTGEIVVHYKRDPLLGLWVPADMRETYSDGRSRVMEAQATYSNFRRFQVKTEETVALPKK